MQLILIVVLMCLAGVVGLLFPKKWFPVADTSAYTVSPQDLSFAQWKLKEMTGGHFGYSNGYGWTLEKHNHHLFAYHHDLDDARNCGEIQLS